MCESLYLIMMFLHRAVQTDLLYWNCSDNIYRSHVHLPSCLFKKKKTGKRWTAQIWVEKSFWPSWHLYSRCTNMHIRGINPCLLLGFFSNIYKIFYLQKQKKKSSNKVFTGTLILCYVITVFASIQYLYTTAVGAHGAAVALWCLWLFYRCSSFLPQF